MATNQPNINKDFDNELIFKERELERRLENFKDVEGVSTRRLNLGLWYLRHRHMFFLVLVWTLVITATTLWCFSIYYFGYYLLIGMKQERITNQSLVDEGPRAIRRDLMSGFVFKTIDVINLGNGHYSLIGEIDNQNLKSWASFEYYFLVDGQKIGSDSSFILPQSKKFVSASLQDMTEAPNTASLVVFNVRWLNLNQHQIPNWVEYKNLRLDFAIRDEKFVSASRSALSERLPMNTLSFSIINQTAFNYFEAPMQIIIYSGDMPVGVKDYIINNFYSRNRKDISLTLVGNFPSVTKVEVIPDINILDNKIFAKPN